MTPFPLLLALLLQSSIIYAQNDTKADNPKRDVLQNPIELQDEIIKTPDISKQDFIESFLGSNSKLFPSSSATLMAQVFSPEKSTDEQLEGVKEMAKAIATSMQNEMINLLSYALVNCDKGEENHLKKKRSVETPMDSSQLVMRLLKHIKSNNEQQNIAIEKMMSAQEIADKFNIPFSPEPEILSDLATAADRQSYELKSMLKDAQEAKNCTKINTKFVPIEEEKPHPNNAYYVYDVPKQEPLAHNNIYNQGVHTHQEAHNNHPMNYAHHPEHHYHHNNYYNPYETQMATPPVQHHPAQPVSQRPNFYDTVIPQDYYPSYCGMEPVTTTTTIVLPFEEQIQPEPELVGEEYEETLSSKVFIDHEQEPGSATVNHVTSFTISEKAHFKTPEIENLPQQMQYYFFMM